MPDPLRASLSFLAARSALASLLVGGLLLVTVAAAGSAALPGVQAAGPRFVATALFAAVGTAAAALVPFVAGIAAFSAARAMSRSGGAAGSASMGVSAASAWRGLWPLWLALAVLAGGVGFYAEPLAWRTVHLVRGSPALAASGWASMQAGEVRTLGEGGAAVLRDGALDAVTGDRAWSLGATSFGPDQAGEGWLLRGVRLLEGGAAAPVTSWEVASLRVVRRSDAAAAEPPRSPWSKDPAALLAGQGSSRARLVLHRRLALVFAVPLLAWLGWRGGWDERGPRATGARGLSLAGVVVVVLALTRVADRAAGSGALEGALAGQAPAVLSAAAVALFTWRWR